MIEKNNEGLRMFKIPDEMSELKSDYKPDIDKFFIKRPERSVLLSRKNFVISIDSHADSNDSSAVIVEFSDMGKRKYIQLHGKRVDDFRSALDKAIDELLGGTYL